MSKKSGMLNLPMRNSRRRRGSSSNREKALRWFSILSWLRAKTVWIHAAAEVWSFAERRIADDIEIGVSRQAETCAERGAAGFFDVDENFGRVVESNASVEGEHSRGRFLVVRAQAVRSAVEGMEIGMSLEDEVGLAREPELRVR